MNKELRIEIIDGRGKPPVWLAVFRVLCIASALFGPGLLIGSAAMQWAGFVVLIVFLMLALNSLSNKEWLTLDQAKRKLDEMN